MASGGAQVADLPRGSSGQGCCLSTQSLGVNLKRALFLRGGCRSSQLSSPLSTLSVASADAGPTPTPSPDMGVIWHVGLDLGLWELQEHGCT